MQTSKRHYRVTEADALKAHEDALLDGGRPGILDLDRVLSAIGRPYHGYHRNIHAKAAALLEAVATSHGFTDGNKRTALILTHILLDRSGYVLRQVLKKTWTWPLRNSFSGLSPSSTRLTSW